MTGLVILGRYSRSAALLHLALITSRTVPLLVLGYKSFASSLNELRKERHCNPLLTSEPGEFDDVAAT